MIVSTLLSNRLCAFRDLPPDKSLSLRAKACRNDNDKVVKSFNQEIDR